MRRTICFFEGIVLFGMNNNYVKKDVDEIKFHDTLEMEDDYEKGMCKIRFKIDS